MYEKLDKKLSMVGLEKYFLWVSSPCKVESSEKMVGVFTTVVLVCNTPKEFTRFTYVKSKGTSDERKLIFIFTIGNVVRS